MATRYKLKFTSRVTGKTWYSQLTYESTEDADRDAMALSDELIYCQAVRVESGKKYWAKNMSDTRTSK